MEDVDMEECERALDLMRLVRDDSAEEERVAKALLISLRSGQTPSDSETEEMLEEVVERAAAEELLARTVQVLQRCGNLERACASLDRFGRTRLGGTWLTVGISSGFVTEILGGGSDEVSRLICRQVGRMVENGENGLSSAEKLGLLDSLAPALGDANVGVAQLAGDAFVRGAAAGSLVDHQSSSIIESLRRLIGRGKKWTANDLRVVQCLLKIAVLSGAAFAKVVDCGVLEGIKSTLADEEDRDELLVIAVMEMVLEMVLERGQSDGGAAPSLESEQRARRLISVLAGPLMAIAASGGCLVMTRCHAVRLMATMEALTGAVEEGILGVILGALAEGESDADLVRSIIDALHGFLDGEGEAGVSSFLSHPLGGAILGRVVAFALGGIAYDDGVQEIGLLTLARFVGRSAALAKPAIFAGLSDSGATLVDCLGKILGKPEEAVRLAAYDLVCELGKTKWGATEVCARKDFVRSVANPRSELVPRVAAGRYRSVCALYTTCSALAEEGRAEDAAAVGIVGPAIPTLRDSVKAGPHGSGVSIVGTEAT